MLDMWGTHDAIIEINLCLRRLSPQAKWEIPVEQMASVRKANTTAN